MDNLKLYNACISYIAAVIYDKPKARFDAERIILDETTNCSKADRMEAYSLIRPYQQKILNNGK